MPKTKVKQPKVPEPFWREQISTYIEFMNLKFDKEVELEFSAPRDLKVIVTRLHQLANEGKIAWTKDIACRTLHLFFHFAWEHCIAPHSERWFIVYCNQKKEEILDKIHQYKQAKQNERVGNREAGV